MVGRPRNTHRWGRWAACLVAAVLVTGSPPASADDDSRAVTRWVGHAASPIDDGRSVGRSVGAAAVVGLGESVHGAKELTTLKARALRHLVAKRGFRSIAWEEQWTTGRRVDRWLRTGEGGLASVMSRMGPQWQSPQVAGVLRWLRRFNTTTGTTPRDRVRFVGVEYYAIGRSAYDAIEAYVARTAPRRLVELRRHLRVVRPTSSNIYEHIAWYQARPDRSRYVRQARRVRDLVAAVHERAGRAGERAGSRAGALAEHHARQVVSFYVHHSLPFTQGLAFRDLRAAQNLRWWRERTGDKVAYWAASAHTADAPRLHVAVPDDRDLRFASAGSHLRRWYGDRYVSVGFTFDRGRVNVAPGPSTRLGRPAPGWFEAPLGRVARGRFVLDLRAPAPPAVRRWLAAPARTRGLPHAGPGSFTEGGSLGRWYDAIVHVQQVTPVG